jgi:hypothetical protein
MAMNKVQFQKGLSMAEFMERYGHPIAHKSSYPTRGS